MESVIITIIILVVAFLFGFYFFKLRNKDFTSNAQIIISTLFSEKNALELKLNDESLTEEEKTKINNRLSEIDFSLSQFFGTKINQIV